MNLYVWSIIVGGCIVTLLPRILPITILSKLKLHPKIEKFLLYIPISILSALIAVELFTENNKLSIASHYPEIAAAVIALFVGVKKNNLLLTVIIGIVSVAIFRLIF